MADWRGHDTAAGQATLTRRVRSNGAACTAPERLLAASTA
jgi:hypothetical protein